MKKSINLKNKILALCASLLVFSCAFLPIFGYANTLVRADNSDRSIITGNIYVSAGDGQYFPLIGNNSSLTFRVYDGDVFISSCFINTDGQFYIELPGKSHSVNLTARISDVNSNIFYYYMYNDRTFNQSFGALNSDVTTFNCYFSYLPFNYDLVADVRSDKYNRVVFDTKEDKSINTRLNVPGVISDYYNAIDFTYNVRISKNYGNYPALWLNINDNSNKFVSGLGVLGSYSLVNSRPVWNIYLKNNVTGSKLLIQNYYQSDFPEFDIVLRLKTYKVGNIVYIEYYYGFNGVQLIWNLFERISLPENVFINKINLQPSACSGSLTYSLNFSLREPVRADLTYVKQQGYDDGFAAGRDYGYNIGYNAGINTSAYSFWDLISATIDVPVRTLTNLFDVEILGVNMKSFIFSIATFLIVLAIVRIWIGSRGI